MARRKAQAEQREPNREEYRQWWQQSIARNKRLETELALAKVTIEALAYTLAYRDRHPNDIHHDNDIPF
ncbi:hypothetical protein [Bosea sp. (in: a-proteobacteria)]|uniref:hypothetical protein n=1 Tax=Bosea sp. (in: a-proteobacteria) TaxID=1871050 RepID=UPI002734A034|nr:hypothetical protein [Bosea sp. (in: a-proteobacteria)]MDP3407273.1 hypothetical protein [Bosea sp. (in: a-proteobacteria)]